MDVGRVGIWSGRFRVIDEDEVRRHASIVEDLGYHALWIPGGGSDGILSAVGAALGATQTLVVASAILNIWSYPPAEVAAVVRELDHAYPGRCLLGLGVSHPTIVNGRTSAIYARPLEKMAAVLDVLDREGVASKDRILAALGPKMLDLARDRSLGAHPYCTTIEHTAIARARLGPDALLAPGIKIVLERDRDRAHEIARSGVSRYLKLENYVNNLLRLGWSTEDLRFGGSDELIDALVGWGDEDEIAAFIHAHLVAGADHVAIQVLHPRPEEFPVSQWTALATLLSDLL